MSTDGGASFGNTINLDLRNYIIAEAKAVLRMTEKINTPKALPDFFWHC